jgi:3-phosphoshikimate 1-carboxyvinyltransferase
MTAPHPAARALLVRPGPPTGAQPHPPGSKYYTLRYVLAAALATGASVVRNPAHSDDTDVLLAAVRALGAAAEWDGAATLRLRGCGGRPQPPLGGTLDAGNAGAVLRLLLGIGALLPEVRFTTPYPESLGRRPNADLLAALGALGIAWEARGPDGRLPITLRGGPPRGGAVQVSGARSSQYLSALLYLAPLLPDGLRISVTDDLRSAPLVRATLRALARAGIAMSAADDLRAFTIPGGQSYRAGTYGVPGDSPSAAALVGAALALGAPLRLAGLDPAEDDVRGLLTALAALGVDLSPQPPPQRGAGEPDVPLPGGEGGERVLLLAPPLPRTGEGAGGWEAVVDGDACTDSVPALVAIACFAHGTTRFERVGTLRLKESDRIGDLCAELGRAGCDLHAEADAIVVRGQSAGIPGGVTVSAHQDHRLAQALAIAALHSRVGLTITGAEHVAKSYPRFFDDLAAMGAVVEAVK